MKYTLLLACLLACTPAQVPPPPSRDPVPPPVNPEIQQEVSGTAPPSVVHGKDGQTIDLATVWADKRVLLVFYMGHWCPHCQKQLAELNDHQAEFAANNVTVIAVSTDTAEDVAALKAKLGLAFDIYSDPEMQTIAKWGVADYGTNVATPASFIIMPGGAIAFRSVGEGKVSVDELIAASAAGSNGH